MRFMTSLAVCSSVVSLSSWAAPIQWRTEDGGNDHWYELVGDYNDPALRWIWADSKAMAEARSHLGAPGHLVTITSAAENQFLIDAFHSAEPWPTWIGLTDSELYGGWESFGQPNPQVDGWVWVTGEPVSFNGWVTGRPDNTNDEDFALIGSSWGDDHLWNDGQSSWHAAFFVEYEPVPEAGGTIVLLSLAMGGLLARRGASRV